MNETLCDRNRNWSISDPTSDPTREARRSDTLINRDLIRVGRLNNTDDRTKVRPVVGRTRDTFEQKRAIINTHDRDEHSILRAIFFDTP